jgi:molybdopterin synthase catalytic subunit
VTFAAIVREPIDPAQVMTLMGADQDGASLLFLGVVRDHNDGRSVAGVQYDAYEEMAEQVLSEIVDEAARAAGTDRVAAVHRIGELRIGEVSVAIAVSSPHRAEAYDASRYIIEEIKKRLPVWKKEHYSDGANEWVEGQTSKAAPPPDATPAPRTDGS